MEGLDGFGFVETHTFEQGSIVRMTGEAPILLLEHPGVVSLDGITFVVVPPVPVHRIDEEKAQHLDPLGAQALLLVEMLPDGPADHLALDGEGVHVAPGFSQPEVALPAGYAELDELVPFFGADFADAAITVDAAARRLFEILAVLDDLRSTPDLARRLDVELDPGADRPPPIAR